MRGADPRGAGVDEGGSTAPDTQPPVPPGPEDAAAAETEERFARPEADRLDDDVLATVRARGTGARQAAFFDLDKTVIARSSTLIMGRTFLRGGLISPTVVLKSLYAQALYQLVGADHHKMEQMRAAVLDLTKGWEVERVQRLVRETLREVIAPFVYQEALDLLADHRRHGRDLWIVSSSGEEIVQPLAEHLGVDDTIATRGGVDDQGCYDGTLSFYGYGGAKATAVRQVADARGYELADCFAYSDSITDLPMLSVVGHPVAVNPDRELRAAATAMGWQIRDFHAPVSLRDRLPDLRRPHRGEVLAATAGALVAGLAVYRLVLRGTD